MKEFGRPVLLALQLKFVNGKITEIEHVVARMIGESALRNLATPRPGLVTPVTPRETNPVDMLKRYSGRVPLLHVKNKPDGIPVQFNETVPAGAFREVGNGVLNIAGILGAATDNGVKHFFVEPDQTPGNPVDSLRQSYDYLRKLTF